jgi:hypothetical protein
MKVATYSIAGNGNAAVISNETHKKQKHKKAGSGGVHVARTKIDEN